MFLQSNPSQNFNDPCMVIFYSSLNMYIFVLALYKKYTYISFKGRKENQLLAGVFFPSHTPAVLYILQPEGESRGGEGGGESRLWTDLTSFAV